MKKFFLTAGFALSLAATGAFAEELTGFISDSHCGAKHHDEAGAGCAQKCVKGGAEPVFVVGDKVYKVDDVSKVAEHVGHKVTITGKLDGDTVKVDSVKM